MKEKGVSVERVLVGSYMTSLEMAGVSLTLMHLDGTRRKCIGKNNLIDNCIEIIRFLLACLSIVSSIFYTCVRYLHPSIYLHICGCNIIIYIIIYNIFAYICIFTYNLNMNNCP